MIRLVVLLLLAANVLFFAWTRISAGSRPQLQAVAAAPRTAPLPPEGPPPCTTIGPISNEAQAQTLQGQLESAGWQVTRRQTTQRIVQGYRVYVTGLTDADDQDRALDILLDAGISNVLVMSDDSRLRIAAGDFPARARADEQAARITDAGLTTQIEERTREATSVWLDLPSVAPSMLNPQQLAAAGVALGEMTPVACEAVVAQAQASATP
ncbi:MAG: SPOR domain-containing protein [Nevskiaceae bacterium]|jgi:hypothetical protein|nr:SPOR domain-containing protein [Nevskiaceae bacterium]